MIHTIVLWVAILALGGYAAWVAWRNHQRSAEAVHFIKETTRQVLGTRVGEGAVPLLVKLRERIEEAPGVHAFSGLEAFGYQIQFLRLEAGAVKPKHMHDRNSQSFVLLRGRVEFSAWPTKGDGPVFRKELCLDCLDHPESVLAYSVPGQAHELKALEDSELLVITKPPLQLAPLV